MWRWDQQEPFGNNPADENPSGLGVFDLPLRLPGQMYDAETVLHYNYYRDFDPSLGRYVESDPIGLRGGLNTYAYVESDPMNSRDPLGLRGYGPDNDPYPHCAHGDFMCRGGFLPPGKPSCCDGAKLAICLTGSANLGHNCTQCAKSRLLDLRACGNCSRGGGTVVECMRQHCGPEKCIPPQACLGTE